MLTKLFLKGRKLNVSFVFTPQSYFKEPKTIRINATLYFIMKILNKSELQQRALNHSSDIEFKDFMKLCKDFTRQPFSFVMNDITLTFH